MGTLVTQIRADAAIDKDGRLDMELLQLLKDAATLTIVCIGVESASDEDLEKIHKRIDSTRMAAAMREMKRHGLLVHGMFIAFTGDTAEVIKRNGAFARKYVSSLQFLAETPLPGHQEHRGARAQGLDHVEAARGPRPLRRDARRAPPREDGPWRHAGVHGAGVQALLLAGAEWSSPRPCRRLRAQPDAHERPAHRTCTGSERGSACACGLRFQAEYRFAPATFLAIGRKRVREFMRDPEYADYLRRLRAFKPARARARTARRRSRRDDRLRDASRGRSRHPGQDKKGPAEAGPFRSA